MDIRKTEGAERGESPVLIQEHMSPPKPIAACPEGENKEGCGNLGSNPPAPRLEIHILADLSLQGKVSLKSFKHNGEVWWEVGMSPDAPRFDGRWFCTVGRGLPHALESLKGKLEQAGYRRAETREGSG